MTSVSLLLLMLVVAGLQAPVVLGHIEDALDEQLKDPKVLKRFQDDLKTTKLQKDYEAWLLLAASVPLIIFFAQVIACLYLVKWQIVDLAFLYKEKKTQRNLLVQLRDAERKRARSKETMSRSKDPVEMTKEMTKDFSKETPDTKTPSGRTTVTRTPSGTTPVTPATPKKP